MEQRSPKLRFYADPTGWATQASVMMMIMSMILRAVSYWGVWSDPNTSNMEALLYIGVPELCGLLFIVAVLLLGKHRIWPSFLPVWGLCAFLVLDARLYSEELWMLFCVVAYVLIGILYLCTVFHLLSTKWVLAFTTLLPFLFHIFVIDIKALQDSENPVLFTTGVRELSVLGILLSLLFIALAMKKKETGRKAAAAESVPVAQPVSAPVVEQAPPVLSWDTPASAAVSVPAAAEAEPAAPAGDDSSSLKTSDGESADEDA